MSYTDAVSRISQIQAELSSLGTAFTPQAAASTAGSSAGTAATTSGGAPVASTSFASVLAQAGATPASGGAAVSAAPLSAKAAGMLTTGQQQFASRLAADTGLDPGVISAWLLAEESGGAASSRQSANNNDWLNIGYTDSGTYGSSGSEWSDPTTAADATAGWLKGQNTIPGYGTASAGIQAVLATAGQPPAAQIAALQQSGWASSGYPDLPTLYQQVTG
jgi:hypothetical protein